ncbi:MULTISPECIES: DUF4174 domain-containing protein [Trichocoleus]|uniref:DUF4174 domain-containing protein n=1 Tax=Trichocoleus desertorum GB2-A4 TaxID=2933944 RepID=A0ABV0JIL7_9CYAN|nr:DUF4174 domain-containing protein [Trichocoleus sp. FACHB-46]MBD1865531.1 DUF4174 domain-containing protein [Trichocoleus sp. FACHB-46]
MQSLPVLVFLSLLQGCVDTQPFILMSDLPNPPQSQFPKVASVAVTSSRSQGVEFRLSDYQWQNRILLVFAPSTGSSDYRQQRQIWQTDQAGVEDRDLKLVAVLETGESQVDGQSISAASADGLRRQFGVSVEEFAAILVGKDGTEKQRSQAPMDLAMLYRTIDVMPMRQQEMRSRP